MKIVVDSIEGLSAAAEKFLEAAKGHRVFAFHAQMGAGKTTFIAELCRRLGVGDESASPTFSILNEYRSRTSGEPICHFDFYRLESPEEAFDIGAIASWNGRKSWSRFFLPEPSMWRSRSIPARVPGQ